MISLGFIHVVYGIWPDNAGIESSEGGSLQCSLLTQRWRVIEFPHSLEMMNTVGIKNNSYEQTILHCIIKYQCCYLFVVIFLYIFLSLLIVRFHVKPGKDIESSQYSKHIVQSIRRIIRLEFIAY